MMKGVVIERATPGNILDVFPLFKEMIKEGKQPYSRPSSEQARAYYWQLLQELANPHELILLARRGRTYWGFFHASLAFRPFGTPRVLFIKSIFVAEKKRKMGISKQMYESAREMCQKMGISRAEFMCEDSQVEYWGKKVKAKRAFNFMVVD
jgi:GNAT superfamily N-acetyltransferase